MLSADEVLRGEGVAVKAAAPPMAARVIAAVNFMVVIAVHRKICVNLQPDISAMYACGTNKIPRKGVAVKPGRFTDSLPRLLSFSGVVHKVGQQPRQASPLIGRIFTTKPTIA